MRATRVIVSTLGVALAAFIGQQDPRRQLEQLGGIGARHLGELVDPHLEIGGASVPTTREIDGKVSGRVLNFT